MKDLSTIKLTESQKKDILSYCKVNDIEDVDKFVKDCFRQGFDVKKYGLLGDENPSKTGGEQEKWVEKEVIKEIRVEVPVEVIKEVEIIKEIIVEKPVEKLVEKIITKTEFVSDDTKVNELLSKIQELENKQPEVIEKEVIKEVIVEKIIEKNNDDKMKMLQETLQSLRKELNLKNDKIKQLEQSLKDLETLAISKGAVFLKNSNLNENL